MRKSRRIQSLFTSYKTMIVASLLGVILGFTLIIDEEFIIGAFFLIVGLAVGLFTILRADKARSPHNYDRVYVGKPRGYTRRVKVLLGLTGLMLVVTAIIGIESILPLIVTFCLIIFTIMYYLIDVKGKRF